MHRLVALVLFALKAQEFSTPVGQDKGSSWRDSKSPGQNTEGERLRAQAGGASGDGSAFPGNRQAEEGRLGRQRVSRQEARKPGQLAAR